MILEIGDTLTGSVAVRGNQGRMKNPYVLLDIPEVKFAADLPPEEAEGLEIGQEIQVSLLEINEEEGLIHVSRDRFLEEQAWITIEEDIELCKILSFVPTEVTRGGLIGRISNHLEGFLPASKTNVRRLNELQKLLGQEIEVIALEAERERGNVLVSMNAALELRKGEILAGYQEGQIYDLPVSGISDFGVFLDLDQAGTITGLLHASELSNRVGKHNPRDYANVGDTISVKLMQIKEDKKGLRISFSLRRVRDAWQEAAEIISQGDEVQGRVANVREGLGTFISLAGFPRVVGLLRGQELEKGQTVRVKLDTFDPEEQRSRLSLV
jgi:small subunit ribosomal protein S1